MHLIMDFLVGISNGFAEIMSHKIRSLLSMIGIILGCASLVATMSIVENTLREERRAFEDMGGINLVQVQRQEVPAEQADIASL